MSVASVYKTASLSCDVFQIFILYIYYQFTHLAFKLIISNIKYKYHFLRHQGPNFPAAIISELCCCCCEGNLIISVGIWTGSPH